ncbi:hypothetical protein HAHE_19880 [Haloferula helveola]|uniref:Uncharacterized protein n=2 Tax=Haloferula helveola TaxID=490095 RepID=A0ABM7RFK4_9BACT|nr:hypothetical protein HAHE_19880 [Haloferula helveola]
MLASCSSSQLPPADQRRVNKEASLQDFAGSYRNGATREASVKLWSKLGSGASGRWHQQVFSPPRDRYGNPASDSARFSRTIQPDSRITLSIEPNGDLSFRNRLKDGTEVGRGLIRAGDYRFEDGWIVIKEDTAGHGPGAYYPGVAVTHKRFALALNAERSLLVEEKGRIVGTNMIILPWVESNHKITLYPRMD